MGHDDRTKGTPEKSSSDRRNNFRVTCPITVTLSMKGDPDGTRLEARVMDLSLGGLRVAIEPTEGIWKDLIGKECLLCFRVGGKNRTLTGRFVGIYDDPLKDGNEKTKKTLEAGIRFEGLSLDDQFFLVDIFGKTRSPFFF